MTNYLAAAAAATVARLPHTAQQCCTCGVFPAGGLFEEQVRKRNTYLLYVLLEDGEACASQVGLCQP